MTNGTQRRIAIFGFEGATALDIAGCAEAFTIANDQSDDAVPPYRVEIVAVRRGAFRTESGLVLHAGRAEPDAVFDTIIVPGGSALRVRPNLDAAVKWIMTHQAGARRVVSVCTGIYALAATGLLDGRRATTHWRFAADVARAYPEIVLEPEAIYIRDGRFYTTAGITAGIDLSLALIEEDLGPRAATAIARELVVYLRRPGGQTQYSEPLRFQVRSADRFADLALWMSTNLAEDLSVDALADRSGVCRRHFTRLFKAAHGETPARLVEGLRMDEATRRLTAQAQTVETVAESVGYRNTDVFRRAFERRYGVTPSAYRERFAPAGQSRQTRNSRWPPRAPPSAGNHMEG